MATIANQTAQDLAIKLQLEAQLRPKVDRLFQRMVNAHGRSVATTGLSLNAQSFKQEWTDLLLEHYKLCQDAFKGSVASFQKKAITNWYLKQGEDGLAPTSEELLGGALLLWAERQAPRQAQFITDTNSSNIAESMRQAREALMEDGQSLDDRSMSRTSSAILKREMQSRTSSIVMTETQSASEGAKAMEAYSLSDLDPNNMITGAVPITTTTKQWNNVGDNKVRGLHIIANGQTRKLGQPFEVGGELLRFPGDSSLGATPKNTANCRCSSIYRV